MSLYIDFGEEIVVDLSSVVMSGCCLLVQLARFFCGGLEKDCIGASVRVRVRWTTYRRQNISAGGRRRGESLLPIFDRAD